MTSKRRESDQPARADAPVGGGDTVREGEGEHTRDGEGEHARDSKAPAGQAGVTEEELEQQMHELEQDPPERLEDWPDGPAKYKTFGGPEGDHSYDEGPERKLGPSSLRRHEDGSVEIEGEPVENPDDYKQEPIDSPVARSSKGRS